jgi:hypothetical protein
VQGGERGKERKGTKKGRERVGGTKRPGTSCIFIKGGRVRAGVNGNAVVIRRKELMELVDL